MTLPVDSMDAAVAADSLPPPPAPRPRAPGSRVVLATLAVGYTLWAAQTIILPVMLAALVAAVGQLTLRVLG